MRKQGHAHNFFKMMKVFNNKENLFTNINIFALTLPLFLFGIENYELRCIWF